MKSVLRISVAFYLLLTTTQFLQAQEWLVFTSENSPIAFNGVSDLVCDQDGNMWCVSSYTIHRRSPGGVWITFKGDSAYVPKGMVPASSLLAKSDGFVYASTDSGLFVYQRDRWERIIKLIGGYNLTEDKVGGIWFNNDRTLIKVQNGIHTSFTRNDGINDICVASSGEIWLADGNGLQRFDGAFWKTWGNQSSSGGARTVEEWGQRTMWMGHATGLGFVRGDTSVWLFASIQTLPHSVVNCLFPASDGRLWIGTEGGIAIYDDPNKWEYLTAVNSQIPGNRVRLIKEDKWGNMWIGTTQGLAIYRKGGIVSAQPPTAPAAFDLSIWPTPATDLINVNALGVRARADITVCDLLGRVVRSAFVEQDGVRQFDVSRLDSGSYFVRLASGATVITRPFVKL